ncbi:MAG: catechol 2,3-dioxygenase-like lactoylglutathione lyase family enzyme [Planctomycetota bacterium]
MLVLTACAGPVGSPVDAEARMLQQYFAVSVADVNASLAWYCRAFDLKSVSDTTAPDGRWRIANLSNDGFFVELIRDNRDVVVERAKGIRKVGFEVADLQAIVSKLETRLGSALEVLKFAQCHQRLIQVRDPDGNII